MNKRSRILITTIVTLMFAMQIRAQIRAQEVTPIPEILESVIFRPVESILEGELIVTGFANDGTATLPITTTVAVACSIVYGTTPAFGALAVDMDMDGGTHTNHHPLLTDLEPETTYYYRVQGTDDAGVIYISPVLTFTTPPRQETAITNLASPELGAEILDYSSAFGGADLDERWGVMSAVDGSENSAWSSQGDGDNAFIEIRLAQRSQIDRIEYWSRSMSDGTAQVFAFNISADDGTIYGPFEVPDANQAYSFEVDFETTTLRFSVVTSSGGNTGAVEFGVYGTPLG